MGDPRCVGGGLGLGRKRRWLLLPESDPTASLSRCTENRRTARCLVALRSRACCWPVRPSTLPRTLHHLLAGTPQAQTLRSQPMPPTTIHPSTELPPPFWRMRHWSPRVLLTPARSLPTKLSFAGDPIPTVSSVFLWRRSSRTSSPVLVDVGGKATAIAAGSAHTCALLADGKVKCWGSNARGQLGRGTFAADNTIAEVTPPTSNVANWNETVAETITTGSEFTCVGRGIGGTLVERTLFCWGDNTGGQLGTLSGGQLFATPRMILFGGGVSDPLPVNATAAGANFACTAFYAAPGGAAFTVIGCWGSRVAGQIGSPAFAGVETEATKFPSTLASGAPSPLKGPLKNALVAAGTAHGCARLQKEGETTVGLDCWGNNTRGQTGTAMSGVRPAERVAGFDATAVTALAGGGENTCAIDSSRVECIGANELGQLGRGSFTSDSNATFANVKLPPTASAISVGAKHACAVLGVSAGRPGQVACWGQNESGQLGDGMSIESGYSDASSTITRRSRANPVRVLKPTK